MILEENRTYYDILDISPDASIQEVREAYVRIKATYTRDSLVLYSLVSPEEREETLKKIETAYVILSDREKRRDYDENHGIVGFLDNPFAELSETKGKNIVSIDRVPPMEQSNEETDILVPPSTDFSQTSQNPPSRSAASTDEPSSPFGQGNPEVPEDNFLSATPHTQYHSREIERNRPHLQSYGSRSSLPQIGSELTREIELEAEWQGPFLKKIREAYKISIEDLSNTTKITKTYLNAIEADNFAKLPAPVYVRGFITQIAKALKLVPERVVPVYMNRFKSTIEK